MNDGIYMNETYTLIDYNPSTMRATWDSEVAVSFIYPDKVVMGVVGPGGGEIVYPIILIMSACLKSLK